MATDHPHDHSHDHDNRLDPMTARVRALERPDFHSRRRANDEHWAGRLASPLGRRPHRRVAEGRTGLAFPKADFCHQPAPTLQVFAGHDLAHEAPLLPCSPKEDPDRLEGRDARRER